MPSIGNFKNFEKQNDFAWMVKPMAACRVLASKFSVPGGI